MTLSKFNCIGILIFHEYNKCIKTKAIINIIIQSTLLYWDTSVVYYCVPIVRKKNYP